MTGIHRVAIACLASALPLICAAGDEVRHAFECDTQPGHFSYWKRSVSSGVVEVSGKVTVNDLMKDKKWSPAANVFLTHRGKGNAAQFGLRLYAVMKTPDVMFLELLKVGGREAVGLGLIPRTKDPVPFTLQFDASGLLKVSLAGLETTTNLGTFKPDSIELSCSTGDFEFTDVIVTEK